MRRSLTRSEIGKVKRVAPIKSGIRGKGLSDNLRVPFGSTLYRNPDEKNLEKQDTNRQELSSPLRFKYILSS